MKVVRMLVGNFELNPSKRPICAWPKLFLTPKRDHVKTQTNKKQWTKTSSLGIDVIENLDYMNGVNKTN